jgi:hypothetical protein
MSKLDDLFAQLPEDAKQRILTEAALRKFGVAPIEYLTPDQLNALEARPLEFLVDGLLARGHLVMLGGRPKSGKSWLTAQLAHALDTGRPFLGRPTRPARVLYLALEDKADRLKQRAGVLDWRFNQTCARFQIEPLNGPFGALGPGLSYIERQAFDFDAIFIDTLIAALGGNISENDNTAMGAIVNELSDIAHGFNCAILLVHHIGKGMSDDVFNLLRGASALRGAYDVGLLLDRKQGEREAVLHVEARDFEGQAVTIRQKESGNGWDVVGAGREIVEIRAGRRVIEALADFENGAAADELAEALGISKATVFRQLKRAERDGHVFLLRTDDSSAGRPTLIWGLAAQHEKYIAQPSLLPPPSLQKGVIMGDKG